MIVVDVTLHSAITGEKKLIGRMVVDNIGTSENGAVADYRVRVGHKSHLEITDVLRRPIRDERLFRHARLYFSVWVLILKALKAAFDPKK